jgi:predicted 2-oxoglutarate/Fe(II)-dependent dioxygenase YbiX/peroxiredoxin
MSLDFGAPAPQFAARSKSNPKFTFGSLGGHYVLLAFLPPPGAERTTALGAVRACTRLFESLDVIFFGVLADEASFQAAADAPPFRWFADTEGEIRTLFDAAAPDGGPQPQWVLIDPSQRILDVMPLAQGERMLARVAALPAPGDHAGAPLHAPVLLAPRIFEPELCRRLIDLYHHYGGKPSGVMREKDGKTIGVLDNFKKRRDAIITDETLRADLNSRISRRLVPHVQKAFQFRATRIERYIVACYDAVEGGYFRPHRDNTTKGTVHRRFAVSINLNADDYEGGDLVFPEFGRRAYRPPTGGAVVFSCSLLHEATPVTRGTRYAFLPFLFDEAAERIRQANLHVLESGPPTAPVTVST